MSEDLKTVITKSINEAEVTDKLIEALSAVLKLTESYKFHHEGSIPTLADGLIRFVIGELKCAQMISANMMLAHHPDAPQNSVGERLGELYHSVYACRVEIGARLVAANSQLIASTVENRHGERESPENEARGWLMAIREDRLGHVSPLDAFEKVRAWVKDAFPASPSDIEIIANSVTPDLIRYFLESLRAYDGKPQNLPTAFKLRRKRRVGRPVQVTEFGAEIIAAAGAASASAIKAGKTKTEADQEAIKAGVREFLTARDANNPATDKLAAPDNKREKELHEQVRKLLSNIGELREGW